MQWLCATGEDNAYYSHDHGYFLGGPGWTAQSLRAGLVQPAPLSSPAIGLDGNEINRLVQALESLDREAIDSAVSALPAGWPITDDELDVVADFADRRRFSVAARLRRLST